MGVAVSPQTGQHIITFTMKLIAPLVGAYCLASSVLASEGSKWRRWGRVEDLASESQDAANVAADTEAEASWPTYVVTHKWKGWKKTLRYGCWYGKCWRDRVGHGWCYSQPKQPKWWRKSIKKCRYNGQCRTFTRCY